MHRRNIPTTYTEARETLNPRAERTIANNTRLRLHGSSIGLILHSTEVVTFNADGSIVLRTGGYHTTTTKDRLNRVARAHGWSVYAKAREWFISHRSGTVFEFEDGFTIPADGPKVPDAREWKDGEVGYCLGLVRARGNGSVPRSAVESYLKVQVASATREKAHSIAADLARAAFYVGQDKWAEAENVLCTACGLATIAEQPKEPAPDFTVENHGTIFLVRPQSDPAREHLEENVDESAQWFGGALAVEHRCILNLVALLREEGFAVGGAA